MRLFDVVRLLTLCFAAMGMLGLSSPAHAQDIMFACNAKTLVTNVRAGPSAKNFPKVSEIYNGQEIEVLGRVTNDEGFDYFKIIYLSEMGNGQLVPEEGYVYHESLAPRCDANVSETMDALESWPKTVNWWGCDFVMADEATETAWNRMDQSFISAIGVVESGKLVCQQARDQKVQVQAYLGANDAGAADTFALHLNGCNATYAAKQDGDSVMFDLQYAPDCARTTQSAAAGATGMDALGGMFDLLMGGFVRGISIPSGTTAEDLAASTAPQDSFCFRIDDNDARQACLEQPFQTENLDSRQILLGNCFGLSAAAQEAGLSDICNRGTQTSCYVLSDPDAAFACNSCGATRKWAATAAAGVIMTCFQ